ncbi:hypothetical protein [Paramagnetospirillum magneticum]|uniref:Uncharacterized protein n=1 Tax=Paramagnetospirillum magneticum (strain ATCC 700264 / AMB-1) TaxID=342108 RepID=Q2W7B0_PARM1|nr:hypothetical protein [Paramagnetospirillum magneticum]BAE50265.1 hypothetical protein amb1461 [Paramagnetospirillum magneticum AMB-1]
MSDQSPPATEDAPARKPWHKPEITTLAVEETATNGSTGNDGSGATTFS